MPGWHTALPVGSNCRPAGVREVVDLLWYEGLSQTEAAEVLGVAAITLKRRWAEARLRLGTALH
jgi:DNA-directed RNA polymerase specialized sigma24 family protein